MSREITEVRSADGVIAGQVERYGVFYPYDGFLSGGVDQEYALRLLTAARSRTGDPESEGAYIVKYSIERVEY